jgi:signal transduction histidine kinase
MRVPSLFASIRPRLAVIILLAMTALGALVVYQEVRKHSEDKKDADTNLQRLATFAAHAERQRFDAAERLLVLASQAQSLRKVASAPDSKEAFDSCTSSLFVLDQLLPETSGFALWDPSGNSLCSSKGATRGQYTVADRLWFQTASANQAIATGAYELAPPDNQPSLGFGLPIKEAEGKNVLAYLSTGLRVDKTDELLKGTNLPDTGRIGIVDQNGVVINSTAGNSGTVAPRFTERFGSLRTFLDGTVVGGIGADGQPNGRRLATVRITDGGDAAVYVAVAADEDALVAPLTSSLITNLWPLGLLTLLTLAAVWLLAQRWVVRPVAALVSASDAIAAGKLGARAHVPPGAIEFEKLGASFNEMATTRERATHAKDEFLGLVSHELKTPITTVLGNAAILRDRADKLDPEMRQGALDDIYDGAQRLVSIIDNLLALARLERGASLESEPMALLRVAEASASNQAMRSGRRVLVRGDSTLLGLGGESYVEQVLENLIGNAIKYTPSDSPVEVFVERDGDAAVVRVCDRGQGIEETERESIFLPFYRSPKTATAAEGVGIGLSVCKRLAEAMGGDISCASRAGGGTEFRFTLQLAGEEAPVEAQGEEERLSLATT